MATVQLINSLQRAELFPHKINEFRVIETHISWVLLTGEYAYKIKKPLDLGFLDFTSLEKRKFFCEEELRLNSVLAPQIYSQVIPIYGSESSPSLTPQGNIIEYAIKMHEFSQDNMFDKLLANNQLTEKLISGVADELASFHEKIATAGDDSLYGTVEQVNEPVLQNFEQMQTMLTDKIVLENLHQVEQWTIAEYNKIKNHLAQRKKNKFIRECHSDVHLGNITLIENKPVIFDCVEFNPAIRWTDTMADVGFMVMDLYDKQRGELANIFLNHYLEQSHDYAGLAVLPYYIVYRAMVRAKISLMRLQQPNVTEIEKQKTLANYESCMTVATRFSHNNQTNIIITHGYSGSGKSSAAYELVKQYGYIQLRSDVVRKHLCGLDADSQTQSALYSGIYAPEVSAKTRTELFQITEMCLDAGYSVIVDATFNLQSDRKLYINLAKQKKI